ncbi:Peptidyl-prolyl cis-trans isomerase CYP18-1 [Diplonema papillatum]|nr:Peptidyl-prolyl cis-trans isomerase CYP18-1 [Diplonema papillatum]
MSLTLHTSHGDLKIELFCDDCPKACENFLALAASGYYDQTKFHRCMRNFIVQGGDPTGTGKGGASCWGTYFKDEIRQHLRHDVRGVLSMANKKNQPDTNGSQFFITFSRQPHLNNVNTVFGKVIHGWETLDKMEKVPVDAKSRPTVPATLNSVTIHANPIADATAR